VAADAAHDVTVPHRDSSRRIGIRFTRVTPSAWKSLGRRDGERGVALMRLFLLGFAHVRSIASATRLFAQITGPRARPDFRCRAVNADIPNPAYARAAC